MSAWPRRIGILGAGAMGCLFAHALAGRTEAEVWLFSREAGTAGLPTGMVPIRVEGSGPASVRVVSRVTEPVDLLLVLVKAYATAEAMQDFAPAAGDATVVLTLQNGLGNAEAIARSVAPERILVGTTAQGATLLEPGLVRHAGSGPTNVAPWATGGQGEAGAAAVAACLCAAGIDTGVVSDPHTLIWSKVAVNCGINPLTALLRVPNGVLLELPGARQILEHAAAEAGRVAAAAGARLPADPVARTLAVAKATAANRSSMLQDMERGRRTEIDAINGAVADLGRALGVPAPVNAVLADLVRAAQAI